MKYTLNQIIKKLETIAENHQQINDFGFGELHDLEVSETQYPKMYGILINASTAEREVIVAISLLFLDLIKQSDVGTESGNENEVLSDMLQVAMDVRSELMNPENEDYFRIEFASRLEPFKENFNDVVAGWKVDVNFRISELKDRCIIPQ